MPWARRAARPKGLRLAPCHTQPTWVRRPFQDPSNPKFHRSNESSIVIILFFKFINDDDNNEE